MGVTLRNGATLWAGTHEGLTVESHQQGHWHLYVRGQLTASRTQPVCLIKAEALWTGTPTLEDPAQQL